MISNTSAADSLSLAFDGHTLAGGVADNAVAIWDISDRRHPVRLSALVGHTDLVNAASFSPDNKVLVTRGADGSVIAWDVADPSAPARLATMSSAEGGVFAASISADGESVAVQSHGVLTKWNLRGSASP